MKTKRVSHEYLKTEYIDKGKSIRTIARQEGVVMATVQRWLVHYDIPRRPTGLYAHTMETRQKLSDRRRSDKRWLGPNNPNWKGGITREKHGERAGGQIKRWRLAVKVRDNFICQMCGIDGKVKCPTCNCAPRLAADHIKPWKDYPELRFEVSNGRTLCEDCHIR